MLDTTSDRPFVLYAKATVIYEGRARSTLELGNYLIIFKADGSLSIHAGDQVTPRNYQKAGSILVFDGYKIVSTNKKETITININQIYFQHHISAWSTYQINISMTERELVDKIVADPLRYLGFIPTSITTEYPTAVGPIDILAIEPAEDPNSFLSQGSRHIVEVKRKVITINNCVQLRKYVDYLVEGSVTQVTKAIIKGYVAGPSINDGAKKYLLKHNLSYIQVSF